MATKKTNNGYTVADAEKYQPKGWGQSQHSVDQPYEYELESGSVVLVKRIGMAQILRMGLLDKLDLFSKALGEEDKTKAKDSNGEMPKTFVKAISDNFGQMEDTIDLIVIEGVIAPQVLPNIPIPNRKAGVVYADTIPFMDKIELFGELLDTEALSPFQQESETSVGDLPADESVPEPAV